MRPLVVDASAALAYVLGEVGADKAERTIGERSPALVPWLFWSEVINSLVHRHGWPGSQVLSAVYDLEQLGLRTEPPSRPFMLATIDAIETHGLTAYDAEYLVLAEASDADLLTADARLATAAGSRAIPLGPTRRVHEEPAPYGARAMRLEPDWPRWPGAARYLEELRQQVLSEMGSRA